MSNMIFKSGFYLFVGVTYLLYFLAQLIIIDPTNFDISAIGSACNFLLISFLSFVVYAYMEDKDAKDKKEE